MLSSVTDCIFNKKNKQLRLEIAKQCLTSLFHCFIKKINEYKNKSCIIIANTRTYHNHYHNHNYNIKKHYDIDDLAFKVV